jgi:hypothetical protein
LNDHASQYYQQVSNGSDMQQQGQSMQSAAWSSAYAATSATEQKHSDRANNQSAQSQLHFECP